MTGVSYCQPTASSIARARLHRTAAETRVPVSAGEMSDQRELRQRACRVLTTRAQFSKVSIRPRISRWVSSVAGRPLAIRTLDAGGDNPIPYLPLPAGESSALGMRRIRTSLWRPHLLEVQLRALLQVRPAGQCRILLPMITDIAVPLLAMGAYEARLAANHCDLAARLAASLVISSASSGMHPRVSVRMQSARLSGPI